MIRVWSDLKRAGVLDRSPAGTTFAYHPRIAADRAVSLTMPTRLESYQAKGGLHPIFEMNLPEGALREHLTRHFAKATGSFDDLDLLGVVGRSQIGRLRYSTSEDLDDTVPFQSVDEILRARRDNALFDYLLERFAGSSGVSGVQPKILLRDEASRSAATEPLSPGFRAATHLVKFWEERDYPELAANEFHCLCVARRAGMRVPTFQLSDNGMALVIDRFDLIGSDYLGMEDFCVLNGFQTRQKYRGSYERSLVRRIIDFIPAEAPRAAALREVFRTIVLNVVVRNGDAHLKNFALLYDNPDGTAYLAPAYDIVSTSVYLPYDKMALTMAGSTRWPTRKKLLAFGTSVCKLGDVDSRDIIDTVVQAAVELLPEARKYFAASPHPEVGDRLQSAWEDGVSDLSGI